MLDKYNFILLIILLISSFSLHADNNLMLCKSIKYKSISSNADIIFKLKKKYPCGKFANDDWWVSADESGYVEIIDISPPAYEGLNGYELNPHVTKVQPYDFRIRKYDNTLLPVFPLKISNVTSIVKTVSVTSKNSKCRPCLQFAAVLTIVSEPLINSNSTFRPGYFGMNKQFYNIKDINYSLLPKLSSKGLKHIKTISYSDIYSNYKYIQLDHLDSWIGRYIHPIDNMPDYGAEIAKKNAISVLRIILDDFDSNNKTHRSALISYLQMAIDIKSMAENGVSWPANGGHGNGRKLPLLFAGFLFHDNSFRTIIKKNTFSEDNQVYYSSKTGRALYGRLCRDKYYWNSFIKEKGPKDCQDPYEYIDGGGDKIGDSYQLCCTAKPWKYTALAVSLLGMKEKWNNDAFFDYVERWVQQGTLAKPDPCAPYNGVYIEYGVKWGGDGECINGSGRFINRHGINKDAGYYNHPLGEEMWKFYKY